MEFIQQEAECSSSSSSSASESFSTDEEDEEMKSFIDDADQPFDDDEVPPFINVTKPFDDGDSQPRLYKRTSVDGRDMDEFNNDKYRAEVFKNSLLCFTEPQSENLFFEPVVYGIYFLNNGNVPPTDFDTAIRSVENFDKLKMIAKDIMLDYTQFGFWEKCLLLNKTLCNEFDLFLRFYERRNKYRYLLRKKVNEKNRIHSEVSTCAVPKFDGYEYLRHSLEKKEKKNLRGLDIVYEPTKNVTEPIVCYFAPKIYQAFSTYYSRGSTLNRSYSSVKQCPYCQNFFMKSEQKMQHHVKTCTDQAGYLLRIIFARTEILQLFGSGRKGFSDVLLPQLQNETAI